MSIIDSFVKFVFGPDKNAGGYRQDRYEGKKGSKKHEHTWSKTSPDGQHKEGWVGKNYPRKHK